MEQEKLLQEYNNNVYREQDQGENIPESNGNNNGIKKYLLAAIIIIIAVAGVMCANKKNENEQNGSQNQAAKEGMGDENLSAKEKQEKQRQENADLAILGNEGETFNVYFSKEVEADCGKVYPVERKVGEGEEMISTSLFHLFSGPTEEEKEAGYSSLFSSDTLYILRWVKVTGGNAYVNLKDIREIIPNASASCGNEQFEAQIRNTISQFVDVNKLVIAIEDSPETYYEWNQMGCQNDLCDLTPFETGLNF
jgi:hypothetical protein